MPDSLLLVGLGSMGIAYAKVLQKLGVSFVAVGRSEESCAAFRSETGAKTISGGIEAWLLTRPQLPRRAIVATSEINLASVAVALSRAGINSLLVEKPGAGSTSELRELPHQLKPGTAFHIGYNRRFYASTQAARGRIQEDGGVSSMHFEFTEWGHVVEKKVCPKFVKDEWFLHNSTHVVDLAFYLGGRPTEMKSYSAGSLPWHTRASKYAGSGFTEWGALFSYHANWGRPGPLGIGSDDRKESLHFSPARKTKRPNSREHRDRGSRRRR